MAELTLDYTANEINTRLKAVTDIDFDQKHIVIEKDFPTGFECSKWVEANQSKLREGTFFRLTEEDYDMKAVFDTQTGLWKGVVIEKLTPDINGTRSWYVAANGNPVQNGVAFRKAYDEAKAYKEANGGKVLVILNAGDYDMGNNVPQIEGVDISSITGRPVCRFTSSLDYSFAVNGNCEITGIDCGTKSFKIIVSENVILNYCVGGNNSFSTDNPENDLNGTFNYCKGGNNSFISNNVIGEFNHCIAGNQSFGNNANGIFRNCVGGDYSFGNEGGRASGLFESCIGGNYSFCGDGGASGTFNNCIGGLDSFGKCSDLVENTACFYYCKSNGESGLSYDTMKARLFCIEDNVALENLTNK